MVERRKQEGHQSEGGNARVPANFIASDRHRICVYSLDQGSARVM